MVNQAHVCYLLASILSLAAETSCDDEDYTAVDHSLVHERRVTALRSSVVRSLLHFFTSSLLHFFTSSLLHFFTSSLLHFFTSSL
ncbi:MAG: hypothetical protein V3V08_21320, partial [Nannocystaceae bacterium]